MGHRHVLLQLTRLEAQNLHHVASECMDDPEDRVAVFPNVVERAAACRAFTKLKRAAFGSRTPVEVDVLEVGDEVVIAKNPHAGSFPDDVAGIVVAIINDNNTGEPWLYQVTFRNVQRERPSLCGERHDPEIYITRPFSRGALQYKPAGS